MSREINEHTAGEDLLIKTSVRLMVPFIQLFGLYVIVHGHYSPGGGFQGGVILGAAFILLAIAFDLKISQKYMPVTVNALFCNLGACIFIGVGVLCALVGGLFLDYSALDRLLPLGEIEWHSFGIFLVELGVGFTVMSSMILLYWNLSSGGAMDEGL
jgi:multicomponent Na+:H+ antiporter subunit B